VPTFATMPPKSWDDEDESSSSGSEESSRPVVPSVRRKFDDEEDSDDVVDSWDAEDSEEERKKVAKVAAAKAKAEAEAAANKKSKAQRIEEHREEARRRRAAEEDESSDEEDDAARRARLRQTEQEADLAHAQDLLDNVGLGPKKRAGNKATIIEDSANPGQAIDLSQISLFKPTTKTQFEALTTALVPLLTASSSKPHYSLWVQDFVKKITADLPSTEIKKAASGLTAQSNEKMKEEKTAEKGGKKSKAAKSKTSLAAGRDIGRGLADTTIYDEEGLGDDDFM